MIEFIDETSNESAEVQEAVAFADNMVDGDEIIGAVVVLLRSNGNMSIGRATKSCDEYLNAFADHVVQSIGDLAPDEELS